jgi:RimJ/RimL family protein N-acetyltransferase
MIIPNKEVFIGLSGKQDDTVTEIARMPGVAENLTEKWTYPEGMPESLTFEIKKDEVVIGQAAFKSFRWFNRKAELSLFLHPDFQSKGLGTSILKSMIHHAFYHMNLHRLEAEVNEYNVQGLRLLEKLGFVKEGVLREARFLNGKYYDIIRFGMLKEDFEK